MRTFILALLATGSLALAGCGETTETGTVTTDDPNAVTVDPVTPDPVAPDPNAPATID